MAVDKDAARIQRLFASISPRYDLLNRVLSLGIDRRWRRKTVRALELAPDAVALDVCTGTADLALALAGAIDGERGGRVWGMDFTAAMVAIGERKRRRRRVEHLRLAVADTLLLPVRDASVDAVSVAFGIRNVADLDRGLAEMLRVLKPGGRAAILEFATPRWPLVRKLYHLYFHHLLPRLGAWISRSSAGEEAYGYLPQSVGEFPEPDALAERMRACGFADVGHQRLSLGIAALHIARRPLLVAQSAGIEGDTDRAIPEPQEAPGSAESPVPETETETSRFTLVVERDSPRPVREIAETLVEQVGMLLPDAMARGRYGGGLLVEDVEAKVATRLEEALGAVGVRSRRLDRAAWRSVPRGTRITSITIAGETVIAALAGGRRVTVRRDQVHGIHLHGVLAGDAPAASGSEKGRSRRGGSGGRRSGGGSDAAERPGERLAPIELSQLSPRGRQLLTAMKERELEAMEIGFTLYCEPPVGPLRARRADLNFATLGDAKLDHSLDNLLVLLDSLVELLPAITGAAAVRTFLEALDPESILYSKPEEPQNIDRWMHQWAVAARAERDARDADAAAGNENHAEKGPDDEH